MTDTTSRRAFLRYSSSLLAAGVTAPFAINLAAMSEAAAATASDYKAIVCVFLGGGNDHANTLVDYDLPSYNLYNGFRPNLAISRSALAPTLLTPTTVLPNGRQYALAPQLAPLLPIFNAGKMAPLLNLGTLIQPTTKAQYNAGAPVPPKLFSHVDQVAFFQSSMQDASAVEGWGGRMADLLYAGNGRSVFTSLNLERSAVFLTGSDVLQYAVSPYGDSFPSALQYPVYKDALRASISASSAHLMERQYVYTTQRALDANAKITSALAGAPTISTSFPANNYLADQLKMVAKLISVSSELGVKRQIFYVQLGGFDNHDFLLTAQPKLLDQVARALRAFYDATVALNVSSKVTTFTGSDFGRSLIANKDGSDHGWGSMQFVLGGAVKGKQFYGRAPVIADDGPDDVGQGRLLPSTSIDQFAATLATWFGVANGDLPYVMPNISNWNQSNWNLGFL
jgi:uncharacterized protein (DUF1501 family)